MVSHWTKSAADTASVLWASSVNRFLSRGNDLLKGNIIEIGSPKLVRC